MSRETLLRALPDAGAPGVTSYRRPGGAPHPWSGDPEGSDEIAELASASTTGSVLIAHAGGCLLVLPPFAVEHDADADSVVTEPLVELLMRPRTVGVVLLRLGGFAVGLFDGDTLVGSKTGTRHVENRHRKGGQSQRRFERIRLGHARQLYDKLCATCEKTLGPYERDIQHLFFGGERQTIGGFRAVCDWPSRLGGRVMERILPVRGDPRLEHLRAAPRDVWSSVVYRAAPGGIAPEARG